MITYPILSDLNDNLFQSNYHDYLAFKYQPLLSQSFASTPNLTLRQRVDHMEIISASIPN